ncbi:hypothetical protein ScalyP_jg401 [Parmales sp. scaly parma]|nr:hypothetical protein ScalyP_jg401 [Parmales sp. scaly parma]
MSIDRSKLQRATDSSETPTPGYLLVDITKMAATSQTHTSAVIVYLLTTRLPKTSHSTKHKTLKLLIYLCRSLPPGTALLVKRTVTSNPAFIKSLRDLQGYKGPPDVLRGDEWYRRVRESATEAVQAVYEASTDVSHGSEGQGSGMGGPMGTQMQGIGGGGNMYGAAVSNHNNNNNNNNNNNHNHGDNNHNHSQLPPSQLHYGSQSPGGMQGFGSSPSPQNKTGGTIMERAREAASLAAKGVKSIVSDPLARGHGQQQQQHWGQPPGREEVARNTGGTWSMASNRGGGSVAAQQRQQPVSNGAFSWAQQQHQQQQQQSQHQPQHQPQHQQHVSAGVAISDGEYERTLIQTIVNPTGFKPHTVPPPDLTSFLGVVMNLNPDLVAPVLLDVISPTLTTDNNKRTRGLAVIEGILTKVGEEPSNHRWTAYGDFFHECVGEIEVCAGEGERNGHVKKKAGEVLRLLGGGGGGGGVAPAAVPVAAPVAAPAADLLGFEEAAPEPVSAPAPAPGAPVADSLFGGMAMKATPGVPPPMAPAPIAPVLAVEPTDLFSAMDINNSNSGAAGVGGGEGGGEGAGSGFGFINSTTPTAATETAATTTTEDPDPLSAISAMGDFDAVSSTVIEEPALPPPPVPAAPAQAPPPVADDLLSLEPITSNSCNNSASIFDPLSAAAGNSSSSSSSSSSNENNNNNKNNNINQDNNINNNSSIIQQMTPQMQQLMQQNYMMQQQMQRMMMMQQGGGGGGGQQHQMMNQQYQQQQQQMPGGGAQIGFAANTGLNISPTNKQRKSIDGTDDYETVKQNASFDFVQDVMR